MAQFAAVVLATAVIGVLLQGADAAGVRASARVASAAAAAAKSESQRSSSAAAAGAGAKATDDADSGSSTGGAAASTQWVPQFFAPQLTPTQFLFISSPSLSKIVYTQLKNFKSLHGRTFALIDSGLQEPCGIAFDRDRAHLYVADRAQKKIFRYSILVRENQDRDGVTHYQLSTDGIRLTIMANRDVEWVAVTRDGDVFYSDQGTKNINKITADTMELLGTGAFQAEELVTISQKEQEAAQSSATAVSMNTQVQIVTDSPVPQAHILSIYESTLNPHVATPAGIASDGLRLYWANQAEGFQSGSVVQGQVTPVAPPTLAAGSDPAPYPATALSNISAAAYGVAKTSNMVLFSSDTGESATGGVVWGVPAGGSGGEGAYEFAIGLGQPRGLAWDGDNTVFVADQEQNSVWSFPIGRLMANAPITKTVVFQGAYGLAMLSESDAAFNYRGGAPRRHGALALPLAGVLALLAAAPLAAVAS